METLWRIDLFGGLRVVNGDNVITRFRSQKTGALLAYLAFYPHRSHPRDLLTDLLWPEDPIETARMKLRTALASLRRQLEPPGVPAGAVIVASRLTVCLNPTAVVTDVAQFEAALQAAARATSLDTQIRSLDEATALYRGPLLPGHYESWIVPEQQRLSGLFFQALQRLVGHLERVGDLHRALAYAGRAVAAEPLREEAHQELIRLLLATGQPAAAQRQYQELERLLREELGETPSAATRAVVASLRVDTAIPARSPLGRPFAGDEHHSANREEQAIAPTDPQVIESGTHEVVAGHQVMSGWLPVPPTRFFGREAEIARLRKLLVAEGARLVTLTGPGGSGKTRLALEAAARLREALDGAVWFVPLADLTDPRRILDAIHAALALPRLPQAEPLEQIAAALSQRPCLLVLDNLEHLMPEAAPIVRGLLEQIPLLQCVVTSRQILELTPEREIVVGPLPVPGVQRFRNSGVQEGTFEDLNALLDNESVGLFIDRAQRAQADFQLTRANAVAVAEVCRRLEGIPLAIELAAARAKQLAPARMLAQLERRFDLLVSRKRDLPSRHQTLRAAIDWSYQLLSPEVRQFFARLFVFRGGFTLEAAAAVGEDTSDSAGQTLEYLLLLQDGSLVRTECSEDEVRYPMLETLREYAAEQLTPQKRQQVARRHAEYFLSLAEAAELEIDEGPRQRAWLDRIAAEHENLRAALDWSQASGSLVLSFQLAAALDSFWHVRGHLAEAHERLSRLLEIAEPAIPDPVRAEALANAASFAKRRGGFTAARPLLEQALEIWRRLGERRWIAICLLDLGSAAQEQGDPSEACRYQQESLAVFQELKDQRGIALASNNMGLSLVYACRYDAAGPLLEQALSINQKRHDPLLTSFNLNNLGLLLLRQGDWDEAHSLFCRSLRLKLELGNADGIPYGLEGLAELAFVRGQMERAVRLLAAADAARQAVGHPRNPPAERAKDERLLAAARVALGTEAFEAAWSQGRTWRVEEAVAYATRDGGKHTANHLETVSG